MRPALLLCLLACSSAPAPALAQPNRDIRDSARDVREHRQQLDEARRYGDHHDVREARRDLREAEVENRENWRDYRSAHREVYARGNWRAPFRYQDYEVGARMRGQTYSGRYLIRDPLRYRLPIAGPDLGWVRHYDDVLLVNLRTGRVHEVHRRFFW